MERYLAVVFSDLVRHTDEWARVPRDRMVAVIAEYRYLAESLAGQYGAIHREWAGDGHMFLFESPDAAARFGLKLIESWRIGGEELASLRDAPRLPLRIGCHFAECTRLDDGAAWIGRGNAVAKRVEAEAEPDSVYVTESVLDLLDLPLYRFEPAGEAALKGDHLPTRRLYRVEGYDDEAKPREELTAEDWFLRAVDLIGTGREWSEEELSAYREALRLRPDYAEAHNNLAVLLRARERRRGRAALPACPPPAAGLSRGALQLRRAPRGARRCRWRGGAPARGAAPAAGLRRRPRGVREPAGGGRRPRRGLEPLRGGVAAPARLPGGAQQLRDPPGTPGRCCRRRRALPGSSAPAAGLPGGALQLRPLPRGTWLPGRLRGALPPGDPASRGLRRGAQQPGDPAPAQGRPRRRRGALPARA